METQWQKMSVFLLRIGIGWVFFYAGITKVVNPNWSAADYLKGAKTFSELYQVFLDPNILPTINFLNEWTLTLIGIALILGIFVRVASFVGILLMVLYYFPILTFPKVGANSFVVDQHIIYILVLLHLAAVRAGRTWGLENWCSNLPICSRYRRIREWIG